MEEAKNKIIPAYKELKGLMGNAPTKGPYLNKPLKDRFNYLVDEIQKITGNDDYHRFLLHATEGINNNDVYIDTYRGMLNALIMRLQGEYSIEAQDPFGGAPTSVITQNNTQTQNVTVQMMIQLGMDLQSALQKVETPEEKTFIETIKQKIETVKSYSEFILLVINLAIQFGITLDRLKILFGHL